MIPATSFARRWIGRGFALRHHEPARVAGHPAGDEVVGLEPPRPAFRAIDRAGTLIVDPETELRSVRRPEPTSELLRQILPQLHVVTAFQEAG